MLLPELTTEATWSVCLRDAATSESLAERGADTVLRTASIGKIFLLIEAAARAEEGTLDLHTPVEWTDEDYVADSGLWYLMRQRRLPVEDLCTLIGGFSDNLAANVLARLLGIDAVAARTRGLGITRTALLDRVRDERGPGDPPTLSRGCASELATLLARLHRGEIVSPEVSSRVLRWLATSADLSMTASAFMLDPLAHTEPDRGVLLVNKTGTISTVRCDVGVVSGPESAIAYAVLAEWPEGTDPRDRVMSDMRAIGGVLAGRVGRSGSCA